MREKRPSAELCGCCRPGAPLTPLEVANRPGLAAIAYRIGTFASFRQSMLQAIASQKALQLLTTRQSDDATITLMELWAAVADVLTFYQERIANEAYLRTARQRDSVLRLARLIDYRLRPGLAATTILAFTVEEGKTVRVPAGLRVMSVPGQDEMPQTFETLEEFTADARLNRLAVLPRPKENCNPLAQGRRALFLRPDNPGWLAAKELMAGEKVVLYQGWNPDSPQPSCGSLSQTWGWGVPDVARAEPQQWVAGPTLQENFDNWRGQWGSTFEFRAETGPEASDTPDAPEEKEIKEILVENDRFLLVFERPISKNGWTRTTKAQLFTRKMRLFGHDAPDEFATVVTDPTNSDVTKQVQWKTEPVKDWGVTGSELPLDATYSDLTAGVQLLIYDPMAPAGDGRTLAVTVTSVRDESRVLGDLPDNALADPRFQATVTVAKVSQALNISDRRRVTVYHLKGSPIPLWTSDFPDLIQLGKSGNLYVPATRLDHPGGGADEVLAVEIGRTVEGTELKPGSPIRLDEIEQGRLALLKDDTGRPILATIAGVRLETVEGQDFLVLKVQTASDIRLRTSTAALLGNAAPASHGEAVRGEALGNGDATVAFQRFTLQKPPLTYIPSARTAGGESTLKVAVNGEEWNQVETLFGQSEDGRVYLARQNDDATTEVQFGDSIMGARLPTGQANIVATYRKGSGLEGRLKAGQLSILLDQLVGLKSVTNPSATEGGADGEGLETARETAPTTVKTFGRAVSLLDFESLIQASGEVARAKASWVWQGLHKAVHLTVAGQQGQPFSPQKLQALYDGLTAQRDPNNSLLIGNLCRIPIVVRGKLQLDPKLDPAAVQAAARLTLLEFFDFANLPFAQTVHLSDIYHALQSVEGVVAVHISEFHFKGHETVDLSVRGATAEAAQQHLRIFAARARKAAELDPILTSCLGTDLPLVIPSEQAYIADEPTDVELVVGALNNG